MGRQKKKKTDVKLRYVAPRDRIEKLELIGNMGYISANPDIFTFQRNKYLAFRRT